MKRFNLFMLTIFMFGVYGCSHTIQVFTVPPNPDAEIYWNGKLIGKNHVEVKVPSGECSKKEGHVLVKVKDCYVEKKVETQKNTEQMVLSVASSVASILIGLATATPYTAGLIGINAGVIPLAACHYTWPDEVAVSIRACLLPASRDDNHFRKEKDNHPRK